MSGAMRRLACALLFLFAACEADLGAPAEADAGPGGSADAAPTATPDAGGPGGELRGVWITRFAYHDQAGLEAIIDRAADAHFNAVFVQIRGHGDAYYRSTHEPWAQRLTGTLGRDPGWDPLQVCVDRAHARGIECHAYFNVFTGWTANQPVPAAEGAVQHPLKLHPEWLAVDSSGQSKDGEYQWLSPGNPAVRAHIAATARELLERYDVDGLHLDRVRTPGADYSRDPVTVAAYDAARAADPALTWGDFMREQVNQMVADLHAVILDVRPDVRFSAAVWGIYRPLPGCSTSQGFGNYYQDSLAWLERGTMDALVPMMYWPIEPGACTDWAALLDGFMAARAGGQIWAGMHALDKVDGVSTWDFDAVDARIQYARASEAQGVVVFASTYLDADPERWAAFPGSEAVPGPFFEPAAPPGAMP
jgi:uncharacterized lipoprotein YddW (UPF0748 family)